MTSAQSPLLSVVIPSHQRPESLSKVLEGLSKQTLRAADFEVVVVLDGPCAAAERLLEQGSYAFALRWFVQPAQGAPSARNLGLKAARGDWIVCFDDDVVPVPECLEAHHRHHDQQGRVVIGGLKPPDAPRSLTAEAADWTQAHFDRCSAPGYVPNHTDLPDGNFSARKSDLMRAGGWDESFVGFGGDDDRELGLRLKRLGLSIRFEPQALGRHFYTKSWQRLLEDRRQAGRAHRYYFGKHPERIRERARCYSRMLVGFQFREHATYLSSLGSARTRGFRQI